VIKKFFSTDENFDKIIKNALPNKKIDSMNLISTGWTNVVYEVKTNDGNYFFRFPRDDFWNRTIVKDCDFAEFIQGKTDYNTAELKLLSDNSRNFSMHKKIEGVALAEKADKLTEQEVENVCREIAEFMYQLHNVKFKEENIFSSKDIGLNLVDFLDELINMHLADNDKKFWDYNNFIKKGNKCLVHGDFNSSNIIIDENNHISAVIDFGFAGFGNKYFDIARIIGRLPENYKAGIIKNYERLSGENLNYEVLDNEIEIWSKIDNGYIKYMKKVGIC